MANTGANLPGSYVDEGGGAGTYSNLANLLNTSSTTWSGTSFQQGSFIRIRTFGFALPANATITSIRCAVEAGRSSTAPNINNISLLKADVAVGSTVSYAPVVGVPESGVAFDDLRGETWLAEDINSTTFGLRFRCGISGVATPAKTVTIDGFYLDVYYTALSPMPNPSKKMMSLSAVVSSSVCQLCRAAGAPNLFVQRRKVVLA